jgi:hypothetical protein
MATITGQHNHIIKDHTGKIKKKSILTKFPTAETQTVYE